MKSSGTGGSHRHWLFAAWLISPVVGATNGYFAEGYGAKSEAIAGASTAFVQDSLTIAANPAGLTRAGRSFDGSVSVFLPSRGAVLTQGGVATRFDGDGKRTFLIPALGYSAPLAAHLSWGVALYGNGGLNTDYTVNPFGRFGASGAAGVNLSQAIVAPALAWEFTAGQSLGIAANIAYQEFEAKGVGLFAGFSSSPANVSNRGKDSATGVGVRLGWLGTLSPSITAGASWQPRIHMGKFSRYAGLFADQGGFDVPETYALGVAYKASDAFDVALDWQRIRYSQVASVGNGLAALFRGVPLGASNGPGFGWQDISVVKLGVRYRYSERLTLRAGFSSGGQPVANSETFFNILAPGVVQRHGTIGGSIALGAGSALDLSYQHAFEQTVRGRGSIPPSFGGGEADVHLAEDVVTVGYSHRF
jgi:long-chain fatty acid transport protein